MGHSLTMLTRFWPLLNTNLPQIDICEGIPLLVITIDISSTTYPPCLFNVIVNFSCKFYHSRIENWNLLSFFLCHFLSWEKIWGIERISFLQNPNNRNSFAKRYSTRQRQHFLPRHFFYCGIQVRVFLFMHVKTCPFPMSWSNHQSYRYQVLKISINLCSGARNEVLVQPSAVLGCNAQHAHLFLHRVIISKNWKYMEQNYTITIWFCLFYC